MKKTVFKLLVITMVVLASVQMVDISFGDDDVQEDTPVKAAFLATGADLMEINHNGWAMINETFLTEEQVQGVIYNAVQTLGLPHEGIEIEKYPGFCSGRTKVKTDKNTFIEVACQTMGYDEEEQKFAETYLMINTVEMGQKNNNNWRGKIKKVLNEFGSEENISTLYSGVISKSLNMEEMKSCVQKAWQITQAKEIEGIAEENLVSMTGYTKQMKNFIELGDERMNMNIALRVNNDDQQTHVMVASPLITTEY